MRRVLRATKYALNKDLRCRAYSVLLDVDSDVVAQLADSTWSVKTMNDGIIEDYIHHVFPRFAENRSSFSSASSSESNESSITEQVLWVVHGVIVNTSAPYSHCHH